MANFPTTLDTVATFPTSITPTTPQSSPSHSLLHNDTDQAVVAIEALLMGGSAGAALISGGSPAAPAYSSTLLINDTAGTATLTKAQAAATIIQAVNSNGSAGAVGRVSASNGTITADANAYGAAFGGAIGGLANNNSMASFISNATAGTLYGTTATGPAYIITDNKQRIVIAATGAVSLNSTIGGAAVLQVIQQVAGVLNGSGEAPTALYISTSFAPSAGINNAYGLIVSPTFAPPTAVTIATGNGFLIQANTGSAAGAITTLQAATITVGFGSQKPTTCYGIMINNVGSAGITTAACVFFTKPTASTTNVYASFDTADATAEGTYAGRLAVIVAGNVRYISYRNA